MAKFRASLVNLVPALHEAMALPPLGLAYLSGYLKERKIDVKTKNVWDIYPAIKIVKLIKKFKRKNSVIVSSFNPLMVFFIKWMDPKILTGFIIQNQSYLILTNIIHPDFLHPRGDIINDRVVSYAKKKNIPINTWTINNAAAWRWLQKKGVSGVITDENPFNLIL